MTNSDNAKSGRNRVAVCPNGHEYQVNELDQAGMDYKCPECFRRIDLGGDDT